jgi:glutathionyl-hydroquinone reductase
MSSKNKTSVFESEIRRSSVAIQYASPEKLRTILARSMKPKLAKEVSVAVAKEDCNPSKNNSN